MKASRPLLLLAAAGALTAVVAIARSRLHGRRVALPARLRRRPRHETWTCACGQAYRVSGIGRHRVYWLADAADADPVLGASCPSCDRPLPRH